MVRADGDWVMNVKIRWLVRRDMETVIDIDQLCFEFPWSEENFMQALRQRNTIGMVAERDCGVVGFMVYELQKSHLNVINFAVDPGQWRAGVGSVMTNKLKLKLREQRRTRITLDVRETNLDAQLFFQRQGFRATSVIRGHYDETDEDAYHMEFRLDGPPAATPMDDRADEVIALSAAATRRARTSRKKQ